MTKPPPSKVEKRTTQTTYRFDYYISEPILGGGWKGRRGTKQVKGYNAVSAVRKLYKALAKKWADPIKLEVDGGLIFKPDGLFAPLNHELLPLLNSNLCFEFQTANKV